MSEERKQEKTNRLINQLEELSNRIKDEKLSPFQKLCINTKIDRITERLTRRRNKIFIQEFERAMESDKDARVNEFNNTIKTKYDELEPLDLKLANATRDLDGLLSAQTGRKARNKEINKVGSSARDRRILGGREIAPIEDTSSFEKEITEKREAIERLKNQIRKKEEDIKQLKKGFIEQEKENNKVTKQQLQEFRPSLWKSIKKGIKNTRETFAEYFKDLSEERKIKKDIRAETREAIRDYKNRQKETMENRIDDRRGFEARSTGRVARDLAKGYRESMQIPKEQRQPEPQVKDPEEPIAVPKVGGEQKPDIRDGEPVGQEPGDE